MGCPSPTCRYQPHGAHERRRRNRTVREDAFPDDDGSTRSSDHALAAAGVANGFEDGTFGRDVPVSRGQMASLIDGALDIVDNGEPDGSYPPRTDENLFPDDDGSTHEDAIDRLALPGVVTGRADGAFRPDAAVQRGQTASFLLRAADLAVGDELMGPVG